MSDSLTLEPEAAFVCDCTEWMRSACAGGPFDKEHEGKRYCVLHFPGKEKSAAFEQVLQRKYDIEDFNFRGAWFPYELAWANREFRAEMDFRFATLSANADFTNATFGADADFRHTIFKGKASFYLATFNKSVYFNAGQFETDADLHSANFNGTASFTDTVFGGNGAFSRSVFTEDTNFRGAKFENSFFVSANFCKEVDFRKASFGADSEFSGATFGGHAEFRFAVFGAKTGLSEANFKASSCFIQARFSSDVFFRRTNFVGAADFSFVNTGGLAVFRDATFLDYLSFAGNENTPVSNSVLSLDLQNARIEKPDHVSFHTLRLRPFWFVNVDASKFRFTNAEWDWRGVSEEVESLQNKTVSTSHRLLAIACWQLAVNAEDNHRYEEASRFRFMAMDVRRREQSRGVAFWRLSWWYWLASGYGERVLQALLVLLGILVLSAFLYNHVGFARWEAKLASESDVTSAKRDDVGTPLRFSRALTYSAAVMTLQKPEPRPATPAAQTVVLLETILGPVQAALLALAIRRKFMR